MFFAIVALHAGQDVNWDKQNYHLYDAFALLHWRYGRDVVPAGPQTSLNPVPYLIPYLLERGAGPLVGAVLLSALQSVAMLLVWCIADRIARTWMIAAVATASAVTAAMVLGEIGTSFEELLLAIPALGSLLILTPPRGAVPACGASRILAAGLLTGLSIGFKITLLPLALALVGAAVAVAARGGRAGVAIRLGAGLAAGFLVAGGAWAAALWWRFGNPFFPFLNDVFRAGAADPVAFGDATARFHGLGAALLRPFRAAFIGIPVPIDIPFRDPRPLAGLLLSIGWLAVRRQQVAIRLLATYLLAGEAAWLVLAPIERYALVLDMLAGLMSVLIVAELTPAAFRLLASVALAAGLMALTRPSDFFHRPWSAAYRLHAPRALGRHYDLVMLGSPLGYWAVSSPSPEAAFGLLEPVLREGGLLQRRLDAGLRTASVPIWAVGFDDEIDPAVRRSMAKHHLVLAPPCVRAQSMYWIDAVFCRAAIASPRAAAASDLATGVTVGFGAGGTGRLYELEGWSVPGETGTSPAAARASLAFRNPDAGPLAAVLVFSAAPGRVTIAAAGGTPRRTLLSGRDPEAAACVGPAREAGDVIRVDLAFDVARPTRLRSLRLVAGCDLDAAR